MNLDRLQRTSNRNPCRILDSSNDSQRVVCTRLAYGRTSNLISQKEELTWVGYFSCALIQYWRISIDPKALANHIIGATREDKLAEGDFKLDHFGTFHNVSTRHTEVDIVAAFTSLRSHGRVLPLHSNSTQLGWVRSIIDIRLVQCRRNHVWMRVIDMKVEASSGFCIGRIHDWVYLKSDMLIVDFTIDSHNFVLICAQIAVRWIKKAKIVIAAEVLCVYIYCIRQSNSKIPIFFVDCR